MPTEETTEAADGGEVKDSNGEGQKEAEGQEPKAAVSEDPVASLKADNARLAEIAQRAMKEAESTKEYVQRLTTQLQMAASRAPQGNGNEGEFDLREALNDNPQAVLDHHFASRMQPLIEQNLGYQVATARGMFEQKLQAAPDFVREEYTKYKDELEEFMKGIPAEVKANPAAWDNALDFVRAKHLDEIVERRKTRATKMERAAFVEGPSSGQPSRSKAPTLSDDQKAIAKGLGMTEEEYISNMVG